MKLNDFKKLEESIKEQDFNKSYKNINDVMFYLSIFGNIASMFLAYFLLYGVLASAIDNKIIVSIASIILLGGLELLKREIFDKFSIQHLKFKSFVSKEVLPLGFFSILLIGLSFYSSLSGAEEFSSKAKEIEKKVDTNIKTYQDSLTAKYDSTFRMIDSDVVLAKEKINNKDKEQTSIESNDPLTIQQKNRVKDLKSEKADLKNEISLFESKKKELKLELEKEVSEFESKSKLEEKNQKKENKSNSFLFVIISTIIELVILSGVYFNEYYKYRSYMEFRRKMEKDVNFQKWVTYNSVLDVIYTEETKINDKLSSGKNIQDLCKVNGVILLNKDMADMFKLFISIGIVKSSGSNKYISKSKDMAQEILRTHFKIN